MSKVFNDWKLSPQMEQWEAELGMKDAKKRFAYRPLFREEKVVENSNVLHWNKIVDKICLKKLAGKNDKSNER